MSSHGAEHGSARTKAARRRTWLRLVIKTFWSLGIKAVNPIAQCLAIHPAGLGCLGLIGAFNYHHQRQHPTRGGRRPRSLRQLTKIRRRIVSTQPDRHRRPPFMSLGPQRLLPPPVGKTAATFLPAVSRSMTSRWSWRKSCRPNVSRDRRLGRRFRPSALLLPDAWVRPWNLRSAPGMSRSGEGPFYAAPPLCERAPELPMPSALSRPRRRGGSALSRPPVSIFLLSGEEGRMRASAIKSVSGSPP